MRKIVFALASVLCAAGCSHEFDPIPDSVRPPVSERTGTANMGYKKVMILYSEGYNNLYSDLEGNIRQLCSGDIPALNDNKAVVVYSHTTSSGPDYITPTEPVIYRIYKEFSKVVLDTLKRYDSASETMEPLFMKDVLNTIRQALPSASYGLIYSSHGDGWVPAIYDGESSFLTPKKWVGAQYHRNHLNVSKMDIADFHSAIPYHLEYIAFDACLMGAVEVAYELKDVCDYIVASPAEVVTDGFAYPPMAARLLCDGPSDLQGMCQDYYEMCKKDSYATIGLYDCSKMDVLASACKPVFEAHRDVVTSISASSVQSYNYSFDYNYDLRDMIAKMGASEAELKSVDEALAQVVIYKASTPYFIITPIDPERFSGISTYLPRTSLPHLNAYYKLTAWNKATGLLK